MNLKRIILIAAAPVLTSISGAVCSADELTDAASTVIGQALRDYYVTMEQSGLKMDRAEFLKGVEAVFNGETLSGFDARTAEEALRRALQPAPLTTAVLPAEETYENSWVEEKRNLPRAEVLEGGVVLQRLTEGSGEHPKPASTVKVMYTGRLSNGTVFDKTEEPFELPLTRIIPGLSKAIEQMRFGGTYRVFIPPSMGYGQEAVMDLIPGNSALDFTIEVIEEK